MVKESALQGKTHFPGFPEINGTQVEKPSQIILLSSSLCWVQFPHKFVFGLSPQLMIAWVPSCPTNCMTLAQKDWKRAKLTFEPFI